jgi:hemerythrin
MAFLAWQESYSVKVPELDQQHQRLVGMLNRLHDALRGGGDPAVAQKVVEELVLYTQHHFSAEERLMESCGYPELEEHRRKHRAMEAQVHAFRQQIASGGVSAQLKLMTFLRDWLQKHILETDMRYSDHLSAHVGK